MTHKEREAMADLVGLLDHYVEGRALKWDGYVRLQAQARVTIAAARALLQDTKGIENG